MDEGFRIMSLDDLQQEWEQEQEILAKQCYVEDDCIVIDVSHEYPIALRRCATPEAILGWVDHLSSKTWITNGVIRRFILLATQHHGITIHPLP